jgi:phosphoenolpyruvate-protein kinase (PTS system EI component)
MARAILAGVAASPGTGVGRALLVASPSADEGTSTVPTAGGTVEDSHGEAERLREAFEAAASELEGLAERAAPSVGPDVAAILEAQVLMARDPALVEPAVNAALGGVPADEAVLGAAARQAGVLAALDDPRFRARAADVRDVGRRVTDRLAGRQRQGIWHDDGVPAVVIADDLGPSETATLRPERVAGMALAGGSVTGHAAIVARALGLPLVLGLGAAVLGLAPGSTIGVDGSGGRILIDPDADEIRRLGPGGPTVSSAGS